MLLWFLCVGLVSQVSAEVLFDGKPVGGSGATSTGGTNSVEVEFPEKITAAICNTVATINDCVFEAQLIQLAPGATTNFPAGTINSLSWAVLCGNAQVDYGQGAIDVSAGCHGDLPVKDQAYANGVTFTAGPTAQLKISATTKTPGSGSGGSVVGCPECPTLVSETNDAGVITYTWNLMGDEQVWEIAPPVEPCCPDPRKQIPATLDVLDPVALAAYLDSLACEPGTLVEYISSDTNVHVSWTLSPDGNWVQSGDLCNKCDVTVVPSSVQLHTNVSAFGVTNIFYAWKTPLPPFPSLDADGNVLGVGNVEWDPVNQCWYRDCCVGPMAVAGVSNLGGIITKELTCMEFDGQPFTTDGADTFAFQISGPPGTIYSSGLLAWGTAGLWFNAASSAGGTFDSSVVPAIITFDVGAYELASGKSNGTYFLDCKCRNENGLESETGDVVANGTQPPSLELDSTAGGSPGDDLDEAEFTGTQFGEFNSLLRLYDGDGDPLPSGCTGELCLTIDCGALGNETLCFALNGPMNSGTLTSGVDSKNILPYLAASSSDGSVWTFEKQEWWWTERATTNDAPVDVVFSAVIDISGSCGSTAGESNADEVIHPCFMRSVWENDTTRWGSDPITAPGILESYWQTVGGPCEIIGTTDIAKFARINSVNPYMSGYFDPNHYGIGYAGTTGGHSAFQVLLADGSLVPTTVTPYSVSGSNRFWQDYLNSYDPCGEWKTSWASSAPVIDWFPEFFGPLGYTPSGSFTVANGWIQGAASDIPTYLHYNPLISTPFSCSCTNYLVQFWEHWDADTTQQLRHCVVQPMSLRF